jgi:hypothetical protein
MKELKRSFLPTLTKEGTEMLRILLILLLPILDFSWDWVYSPKYGGIWITTPGNRVISYVPDLGIKEIYSVLPDKPYCKNYKFSEEKYKLIWDYPIKVAIFQCPENTFITLDEEIGNINYLYRNKVLKTSKSGTIQIKGKREIFFGEWRGEKYFIPTYTYLIK